MLLNKQFLAFFLLNSTKVILYFLCHRNLFILEAFLRKNMVGFDETLNQLNEVIKNKYGQENKVNIRGFSRGSPLEEVLNEFEKKNGRSPTFSEIITEELWNRNPQDFQEGDEIIHNAYPLSESNGYYGKIKAYFQKVLPELLLIRTDIDNKTHIQEVPGVFSIRIVLVDNGGNVYNLDLEGSTNKLSLNSRYPLEVKDLTMKPANPEAYPKDSSIRDVLCYTNDILEKMRLSGGINNVIFYKKEDFGIEKIGEDLYKGKINIAELLRGTIEMYRKAIPANPDICKGIFNS